MVAAAITAVTLMFAHLPAMNKLFHTEPLDALSWALIVGAAWAIAIIVAIEKHFRRRAALRSAAVAEEGRRA